MTLTADVLASEVTDLPDGQHAPKTRSALARIWFVLRPLAQAIAVSFCVVIVTFFLIRLFLGDPARQKLGLNASQAQVDQLRAEWGLNHPLMVQFVNYLGELFQGNLGVSINGDGTKVATLIFGALGNTALLAITAVILATIIGIALGLWAAVTRIRLIDAALRGFAMLALASPPALIGLLLILLIAVKAGLAPVGGWGTGYPSNLRYAWLPVISLTIMLTPMILRTVRQRALEISREPHLEAARARGMRPLRLVIRHLLPNAALPVITVIGLSLGGLLSGAAVVEVVYGVPGLGQVLLNAMQSSDFPVIQGGAMIAGTTIALCNAIAETVQRAIDPRVR